MEKICRILMRKFAELEEFHHKTLHELRDAAQIIKSYEYLEKRYRRDQELLESVMKEAEGLCKSEDFESYKERRDGLLEAIQDYRIHARTERAKTYPRKKFLLSSHSHRSTTAQMSH